MAKSKSEEIESRLRTGALSLLERDGALMLVGWGLGLATVATVGVLSGSLASLVTPWIDRLI